MFYQSICRLKCRYILLTIATILTVNSQAVADPIFSLQSQEFNWSHKLISAACFAPDGTWIAVGGGDDVYGAGIVSVFDTRTRSRIGGFRTDRIPTGIAVLSDNANLVCCCSQGRLIKYKLHDKDAFTVSESAGQNISIAAKESLVALSKCGNGIAVWDLIASKPIAHRDGRNDKGALIGISANGKYVAFNRPYTDGIKEAEIEICDGVTLRMRHLLRHESPEVHSLQISPDSKSLAVAGNGRLVIWDIATGAKSASIPLRVSGLSIEFSQNSKWLAVGGLDKVVILESESWKELGQIDGEGIYVGIFAPDTGALLTCSSSRGELSGEIRIWPWTGSAK